MKKLIIFFVVIIIILAIVINRYIIYIDEYNILQLENSEYENYYEKKILGTNLASVINKVVDQNSKNNIEKDNNNEYIDNDEDSILIDIKFSDADVSCKMEVLYNSRNK